MKRVSQHFAKGGKLNAGELNNAVFHSMPGSTKLLILRRVSCEGTLREEKMDNIITKMASESSTRDSEEKKNVVYRIPEGANFEDWYKDVFKNGYKVEGKASEFQAHHVIPINILKNNKDLQAILKWADDNGRLAEFDFNGIENGIAVQRKKLNIDRNGHTRHDNYSNSISGKITSIYEQADGNIGSAFNSLLKLISDTKVRIKEDVLLGIKNIDDLRF